MSISNRLPVVAEVMIPVEDYPWVMRGNQNGDVDRFYHDGVGPLADSQGLRKTFGLNSARTHVVFQFHDEKDLPKIVLFKLKWGRK